MRSRCVAGYGFYPAKDTEAQKLSEDTEMVENALFGMEDLRSPLLPQPSGLEPGPLGSASHSESDPRKRSLFREPPRYFVDNSVPPTSSDDGVPVPPARFPESDPSERSLCQEHLRFSIDLLLLGARMTACRSHRHDSKRCWVVCLHHPIPRAGPKT